MFRPVYFSSRKSLGSGCDHSPVSSSDVFQMSNLVLHSEPIWPDLQYDLVFDLDLINVAAGDVIPDTGSVALTLHAYLSTDDVLDVGTTSDADWLLGPLHLSQGKNPPTLSRIHRFPAYGRYHPGSAPDVIVSCPMPYLVKVLYDELLVACLIWSCLTCTTP